LNDLLGGLFELRPNFLLINLLSNTINLLLNNHTVLQAMAPVVLYFVVGASIKLVAWFRRPSMVPAVATPSVAVAIAPVRNHRGGGRGRNRGHR
jgi:hypothetical protein